MLLASCNHHATTKGKDEPASLSFIDSIPIFDLPFTDTIDLYNLPHSSHIFNDVVFGDTLSRYQMELLDAGEIIRNARGRVLIEEKELNRLMDDLTVEILYRLNISDDFHSLLYKSRHGSNNMIYTLINYDQDFNQVGIINLGYFAHPHKMYLHFNEREIKQAVYRRTFSDQIYFLTATVNDSGEIETKSYAKPLEKERLTQVVKAYPGVVIRDTLGDSIDYFEFGSKIIRYGNTEDTVRVRIDGRELESILMHVITDYDLYLDQLFISDSSNFIGILPEIYLFDDVNYNTNNPELHEGSKYYYTYHDQITIDGGYYSHIDLNELLEIEKVEFEDYEKKVIKSTKLPQPVEYADSEPIHLKFKNGRSRILKDTIFRDREYNPTSSFRLYSSPDYPEAYLINHSYFEDSYFFLLSKENGDTLQGFIDYPFVSPNQKRTVSFYTPLSYEERTAIFETADLEYPKDTLTFSAEFYNWNIPPDLEVHWLSEDEFIIKAMEVQKAFEEPENPNYFYLKFRVKDFRVDVIESYDK